MSSTKEDPDPDLAPAGLALLIIFGLLIWQDKSIESARPFNPYAQPQDLHATEYAYESWLWQDPFGFDLDSYIQRDQYHIELDTSAEEASHRRYRVDKNYKVHKKLDVEPIDRKKEFEGHCDCQLNRKIRDIRKISHIGNDEKNDVKILAPLLKVRPDIIENKEVRTRQRYAVIAGLIESGYRPSEPDVLHFCSSQKNSSNKEYDMRWEHYRHESENKPDIIIAWMNSEIFTDDDRFFKSRNMLISREITNFSIYDLNSILDSERSKKIREKIDDINNNKNKNIKLIEHVGRDNEALNEKLTEELIKRRDIKETSEVIIITEQDSEDIRKLASSFDKAFCNHKNTERDCKVKNISYLKGLDGYQKKIDKQDKNENQAADKRVDRGSAIDLHNPLTLPFGPSQVDYFHRLAKQINDPHQEINLEKRDSGIKAVGIFGSDFYDKLLILEALRTEMPHILVFTTDLDAEMLQSQHWRSTRNLVVASHFDLLLKDRDKDDKGHQKQTYQDQFPPFRDSQQTSIFFRIISTVTGHVPESKITSPQIFEIGRNGFVRLGAAQENENYRPPDDALDQTILGPLSWYQTMLQLLPRDQPILQLLPVDQTKLRLWLLNQTNLLLLLLAWMIVSLICFHRRIRPNSGESTFWLSVSTSAIFCIAWVFATDESGEPLSFLVFAADESGEPLSFTDGISLWPSIFIQLIAMFMAIAFFIHGKKELHENFESLCEKRRYSPSVYEWESSRWGKWARIILVLLTVIILVLSIASYALNDVTPSGWQFIWCLSSLVVFALVYALVKHLYHLYKVRLERKYKYHTSPKFDLNSIKDWIEKGDPQKDNPLVTDEKDLWREYYNYGLLNHRVTRVVAIWLFFAIIETILIYLLPPWPLPCRGSIACFWASSIGVLSFTAVMLLLFFILDAFRLSYYWIETLRKRHPLLNTQEADNNILESLEKIVTVVAERTKAVDKLIYYPMLCIMLMLFAKITYFDNQDFPFSKAITFAASISLLFFSGFTLRSKAKELKLSVIERATNVGRTPGQEEQADKAIKRIKDIREGAFLPMFEQPVMRALLIILASIGLFANEYPQLFGLS